MADMENVCFIKSKIESLNSSKPFNFQLWMTKKLKELRLGYFEPIKKIYNFIIYKQYNSIIAVDNILLLLLQL